MFESFFLIVLIILALHVVLSDNLLRSNIYLGVFSLTMALAYLYYNAPDVALAEAAIGVGLSTIMYLIALKKVTVYDICFVNEEAIDFDDDNINRHMNTLIRPLEIFIEKIEEIEPQISYSNKPMDQVMKNRNHDLILLKSKDTFYFYGHQSDEIYEHIQLNIEDILEDHRQVEFIYMEEEGVRDDKDNK